MRLPSPPKNLDAELRQYLDALIRELETILANLDNDVNGGGA